MHETLDDCSRERDTDFRTLATFSNIIRPQLPGLAATVGVTWDSTELMYSSFCFAAILFDHSWSTPSEALSHLHMQTLLNIYTTFPWPDLVVTSTPRVRKRGGRQSLVRSYHQQD